MTVQAERPTGNQAASLAAVRGSAVGWVPTNSVPPHLVCGRRHPSQFRRIPLEEGLDVARRVQYPHHLDSVGKRQIEIT